MESHLVPFYSCIFAIYYFVLSVRVIKARRRFYVPLGDGTLEYLAFIELERWKTQSSLSSNDQGKAIQKPHLSCRPLNLAGFHEVQRKVRAHANFVEYLEEWCIRRFLFLKIKGLMYGALSEWH
ncbi:hypothetical protein G9A89_016037 [Geosiphon pyriformis]|nr:hypothetical protein G9A89_016037 [Geosiphon pyriformis]